MEVAALLPLGVGLVLAVGLRPLAARLRPAAAAWVLVVGMVVGAAATLASLGLLAWLVLASDPTVAALGEWRGDQVIPRADVPLAVALAAVVALCWVGVRLIGSLRRHLPDLRDAFTLERQLPSRRRPARLVVVDGAEPVAHAVTPLPGRAGHIVVSRGLWDRLDDHALRRAVLEHERAHLRHRHGVLLTLGEVAVAVHPLLLPSLRRLRFELERWADEEAAARTSRVVVAEALATIALAHRAAPALAFDGAPASARIRALLAVEPTRPARLRVAVLVALSGAVVTVTATACRHTEVLFETLQRLAHHS